MENMIILIWQKANNFAEKQSYMLPHLFQTDQCHQVPSQQLWQQLGLQQLDQSPWLQGLHQLQQKSCRGDENHKKEIQNQSNTIIKRRMNI